MRDRSTVFLIDDHPIVAAGLRLAFEARSDLALVGVSDEPCKAVDMVAELGPQALIMDLVFQGQLEINYIRVFRELRPEMVMLVFSSLAPELCEQRCLDAGADAFVSKSEDPRQLAQHLARLLATRDRPGPAPRRPSGLVIASFDGVELTPREAEVAAMLAAGRSVREIAQALALSRKTVAIHRDNLKTKLHCTTSQALTALLARLPEFGSEARHVG